MAYCFFHAWSICFSGVFAKRVSFLPHIKKIALEFYKSIAKRYIAVYVGRPPVFLEPRHRITGHAQGPFRFYPALFITSDRRG